MLKNIKREKQKDRQQPKTTKTTELHASDLGHVQGLNIFWSAQLSPNRG